MPCVHFRYVYLTNNYTTAYKNTDFIQYAIMVCCYCIHCWDCYHWIHCPAAENCSSLDTLWHVKKQVFWVCRKMAILIIIPTYSCLYALNRTHWISYIFPISLQNVPGPHKKLFLFLLYLAIWAGINQNEPECTRMILPISKKSHYSASCDFCWCFLSCPVNSNFPPDLNYLEII